MSWFTGLETFYNRILLRVLEEESLTWEIEQGRKGKGRHLLNAKSQSYYFKEILGLWAYVLVCMYFFCGKLKKLIEVLIFVPIM
jgi:hypothetical protein